MRRFEQTSAQIIHAEASGFFRPVDGARMEQSDSVAVSPDEVGPTGYGEAEEDFKEHGNGG